MPDAEDDLATRLAVSAGEALQAVRAAEVLQGRQLGDAGDAVSQAWLSRALRATRPRDGLLSEEGGAGRDYLAAPRIWIVDPLDGTREYSEQRPDWAVHVALVRDGRPIAAAVALPAVSAVLSTGHPIAPVVSPPGLKIAVSRTRAPRVARRVADVLGGELVPMGSAGWKAMAVVRGQVHAYLHAGGMYEWDTAAPAGVAAHAGLHVSALDGTPLRFGKPDAWTPELLICRPELAEPMLSAIAAAGE